VAGHCVKQIPGMGIWALPTSTFVQLSCEILRTLRKAKNEFERERELFIVFVGKYEAPILCLQ